MKTIDLWPPMSPRFAQIPWRDYEPMFWRGRVGKRVNPKAKAQKAAKRARKITRRAR